MGTVANLLENCKELDRLRKELAKTIAEINKLQKRLQTSPEIVEKPGDTCLSRLKTLFVHVKELSESEVRVEKPKIVDVEEEAAVETLLLEDAPSTSDSRDKCYIHLVTLMGDLQTRMLKTFEVVASQIADHGVRLDEALKETSGLKDLLLENNGLLKGIDERLTRTEKTLVDWKDDLENEADESDAKKDEKAEGNVSDENGSST